MASFADSCIVLRAEHTLGETWEKHVKHLSRSRSTRGVASAPWRILGAVLLALGMVLLAPTAIAGAQTDDSTPDEETTSSVPEDTVPDTVPEDTSTTVPEVTTPEDTTPDDPRIVLEGTNIRIVQTPDEEQGPCSPIPATALINYVGSTDEEFILKIVAQDPLCDAIEATAAIYGMPGNGEAWPQTLVETLDFRIKEAGEYVVTFTKTCDPVQFDVITGDTPPVIAPLGEWHGPMLFPFDTNTSLQHWGCDEPEVENVTTVPTVAGITQEPAALAITGTSSTGAAVAGGAALLAGAALLLVVRRRSA